MLLAIAAVGATMLLLSGQHWLKNWIWYGDPLFPVLYDHLPVHPWSQDSSAAYRVIKSFTFPPRPGLRGLGEALLTTLTFSFIPNDEPNNTQTPSEMSATQ